MAAALPATLAAPRGMHIPRTTSVSPFRAPRLKTTFPALDPLRTRRGVKASGIASLRHVVRAQSSPDYLPDAKFYKVEALVRPCRVAHVSSGLLKMGIRGVTISDVRGIGAQEGSTERHAGSEFAEDMFVVKTKMEIVVSKDQVESVIQKIMEEAVTGEIGDGKIFVLPVSDVMRVRTGERGEKAEKMAGGRSDMLSSTAVVQLMHP